MVNWSGDIEAVFLLLAVSFPLLILVPLPFAFGRANPAPTLMCCNNLTDNLDAAVCNCQLSIVNYTPPLLSR